MKSCSPFEKVTFVASEMPGQFLFWKGSVWGNLFNCWDLN